MTRSNGKLFGFPGTFWTANVMELFERWAWYGMFILLALYFTGSTDEGALGFTQGQKGLLMGTVVGILYVLPTITGAIADKFGYKRILILSYIILGSGYLLMGYVTTYASMFLAFLYLALGAGLFKPVISATITKTTTEKTASIGFGIFYMIVNIGAFVGPVVASKLREIDWQYAFWMSSGAILVNIILVIIFYKEPERERVNEPLSKTIRDIFTNLGKALTDYKLVVFLLIIVGFWTMYNQLFFTLPGLQARDLLDVYRLALENDSTLEAMISAELESILNMASVKNIFGNVVGLAGSVFIGIFSVVFLTFFFLRDEHLFFNGIMLFVPAKFVLFQSIMSPSKNLSNNEGNDGYQLFDNFASVMAFPSIFNSDL